MPLASIPDSSTPAHIVTYVYGSLESIALDSSYRAKGYVTTFERLLGHALGYKSHALALAAVSGLAVTTSITSRASNLGLPIDSNHSTDHVTAQKLQVRSRSSSFESTSTISRAYFDSLEQTNENESLPEQSSAQAKEPDSSQDLEALQRQLESSLERLQNLNRLLDAANSRIAEREAELVDIKRQLNQERDNHKVELAGYGTRLQSTISQHDNDLEDERSSSRAIANEFADYRKEMERISNEHIAQLGEAAILKKQLNESRATHEEELHELRSRLENTMQQRDAELADQRTTAQDMGNDLTQARATIGNLTKQSGIQSQQIDRLNQELMRSQDTHKKVVSDLEHKSLVADEERQSALEKERSEKQRAVDEADRMQSDWKKMADQHIAEVASLQSLLQARQRESSESAASAAKEHDALSFKLCKQEAETQTRQKAFDISTAQFKNRIEVLESELQAQKDRNSQAEAELKQVVQDFDALRLTHAKELEQLRANTLIETQHLKAMDSDNRQTLARLEADHDTIARESVKLKAEHEKAAEKHAEELRTAESRAAQKLSTSEVEHKKQLHEKQIVNEQLRADLAILTIEFEQLKTQQATSNAHQLQQLQRIQVQTDKRISELEAQHASALQSNNEEFEQYRSLQESDLQDLEDSHAAEINHMKDGLQKTLVEVEQLRKQHNIVVQAKAKLESELRGTKTQLDQANTAITEAETASIMDKSRLQKLLDEHQDEIKALKQEIPSVTRPSTIISHPKEAVQESASRRTEGGLQSDLIDHLSDSELSDYSSTETRSLPSKSLNPTSVPGKNFSRRQPSISLSPIPTSQASMHDRVLSPALQDSAARDAARNSLSPRTPPRRRSNSSAAKVHALTGDAAASDAVSTGTISTPPSPVIPQGPVVTEKKGIRGLFRRTSGKLKRQSLTGRTSSVASMKQT